MVSWQQVILSQGFNYRPIDTYMYRLPHQAKPLTKLLLIKPPAHMAGS